jgi:spore germination protein YaaH
MGQNRGAQVVPMIGGSGKAVENMLASPAKRAHFVNSVDTLVRTLGCDGFLIDFELLPGSAAGGLNSLMAELYRRLHPQGKLVIISVMARTTDEDDSWPAYDYATLSRHSDYIQVMSYDKHHMTSAPGPIAPLDWVDRVMAYTVSQVGHPHTVLMGLPYYGRAWKKTPHGYTSLAFGLSYAQQAAGPPAIQRHITPADPVGIPTFRYTDPKGVQRTVYYDDAASWGAKLDLLEKYNLGGIGAWALHWIDEKSAEELFPLLKQKLRTGR